LKLVWKEHQQQIEKEVLHIAQSGRQPQLL